MSNSIMTEQGRTLFKNQALRIRGYIAGCLAAGIIVVGALCVLEYRYLLSPLQTLYGWEYFLSSFRSARSSSSSSEYKLLVRVVPDPNTGKEITVLCQDSEVEPVLNAGGEYARTERHSPLFTIKSGITFKDFGWQRRLINDTTMNSQFRNYIYEGRSLFGLTYRPLGVGGLVFLLSSIWVVRRDFRQNREFEKGKQVGGTRELSAEEYAERCASVRGLKLKVSALESGKMDWLRARFKGEPPPLELKLPQQDENEHILILGDPGTGKSQLIHHILDEVQGRESEEPAICFDPAGEFIRHHFNAARGDIVLNPLDLRFPYWRPYNEVRRPSDRELIAESFFPGRERQSGTELFFTEAKRTLFARMLEFDLSPEEMVKWLQDENKIDAMVKGTEYAKLIDKRAPNQRNGVLGDLSLVGRSLRHLPSESACSASISLTDWARERRGWIFITSTPDTRQQLRLLQAVFLNILMKRLMSENQSNSLRPCWLIVDEAHALGRLPAFHNSVTEGRKHGIKVVIGTQNKAQLEEHYGHDVSTMLAAPHLKIFFRSGEVNSARWISDTIGEAEWERRQVGTTATVANNGRDSINYSTYIERRPVITREQIMAVPKLHAFWKYEGIVVPFRLPVRRREVVASSFESQRNGSILATIIQSEPVIEPPSITEERAHQMRLPLLAKVETEDSYQKESQPSLGEIKPDGQEQAIGEEEMLHSFIAGGDGGGESE